MVPMSDDKHLNQAKPKGCGSWIFRTENHWGSVIDLYVWAEEERRHFKQLPCNEWDIGAGCCKGRRHTCVEGGGQSSCEDSATRAGLESRLLQELHEKDLTPGEEQQNCYARESWTRLIIRYSHFKRVITERMNFLRGPGSWTEL